jgi:ABC-type Zn uptake system ZnuABC Zn-binding protein ZnuA
MEKKTLHWFLSLVVVIGLAGCQPATFSSEVGPMAVEAQPTVTKLSVVATTTIVGDVVYQVGGDFIELAVLLPPGADPHGFQPTPQDVAKVTRADLLFINGLGLEEFLDRLMENAGGHARVVSVSDGIEPRASAGDQHAHEAGAGDEHAGDPAERDEHEHMAGDPHVWVDPHNVMVWARNIARALGEMDHANASAYEVKARRYQAVLEELDAWIREQVAAVPETNRAIVTDHIFFSYFADRYGFTQLGTIIPGYSTMAGPSAQELARLEDAIRDLGVKAVFVGNTVNPGLAERVAEDTNIRLVFIYTGSLTDKGGPADSYVNYMRYNVSAIVEALK